jgi:uncharacterized protein (TIGR00255 family)
MKSMTGYGTGLLEKDWARISLSIRSVNSRFLDIDLKIPSVLSNKENELKSELKNYFSRGRIDVSIRFEWKAENPYRLNLDPDLFDSTYRRVLEIQEQKGIPGVVDLNTLLNLPNIVHLEESDLSLDDERMSDVLGALAMAAKAADAMRILEGKSLESDIEKNLGEVEQNVLRIEGFSAEFSKRVFEKLKVRLEQYPVGQPLDETRLYQEVALMAERSDISEEIARLKSHIAQLRALMRQDGPVGKEIDFLLQEMNREVNTLSSKARDSEISSLVVNTKSRLEKIREQARNAE